MIQAMQVRGVLWKYASNRLAFHEHGSYFHLQCFFLQHPQNGAFFLLEQRFTFSIMGWGGVDIIFTNIMSAILIMLNFRIF